ncbi:MAG: endoribonuclease MazF [Candidatus Sigynarchaeota archaeon]
MVKNDDYIPKRGDAVWLDFSPQIGHEQKGRRPAVVISPEKYNKTVGLMLACPITTKVKNYPFEVAIPDDIGISGVILSDQVKSLDWRARNVEFICALQDEVIDETLGKLSLLIT